MSHVTQGDVQALVAEIAELKQQLGSRKDGLGGFNSTSSIRVDAGGIGVWMAVTACCVMMGVNLFLAVQMNEHSRKIDDLGDYLSAIYMQAPHLKPKEETN